MALDSEARAQGARLLRAREHAGYATGTDAAAALKISRDTYLQHENGTRSLKRNAQLYGERFGVPAEWLIWGKNPPDFVGGIAKRTTVPIVGYVSAGAQAVLFGEGQGPFDEVDAPDGATENTVAVEIRGDSLGPLFNEWLVYYDDVRRPVTTDLIGRLCVVGLPDHRILVKKLQRSRSDGLFHLLSQTEDPILDAEVEWAARVRSMTPR